MSDLVPRPAPPRLVALPAVPPNPLLALPPEWQRPVDRFGALFADILKGNVGLAARFSLWIEEDGLALAEALAAMKAVSRRAVMARIRYVGELLAELAAAVEKVLDDRRRAEQAAAARAQHAADLDRFAGPPQVLFTPSGGRRRDAN